LAIAVIKNYLLVGLSKGDVILFDSVVNMTLRVYHVSRRSGVSQIIVGKKDGVFLAVTLQEIVEYSYLDRDERFRFTCGDNIRAVLADERPILIIDFNGYLYEYHPEISNGDDLIVRPILFNLEGLSFAKELRCFDAVNNGLSRICLIRNKCCVAIVDLLLINNQRMNVWKKEILTNNPADEIIIDFYQTKIFYTTIESVFVASNGVITVMPISELGNQNSKETITIMSGPLYSMVIREYFLITQSRNRHIEIFIAENYARLYKIVADNLYPTITIVKNCLILGTDEASLIIKSLPVANEYCLHCASEFAVSEDSGCRKICFHFLPNTAYRNPI
jgi:hypothetical protein